MLDHQGCLATAGLATAAGLEFLTRWQETAWLPDPEAVALLGTGLKVPETVAAAQQELSLARPCVTALARLLCQAIDV